MAFPPDLTALQRRLDAAQEILREHLDPTHPRTPHLPEEWAAAAADWQAIDRQVRWCRDATTVLARRAGATWATISAATGVADSTLSNRTRRFTQAEGEQQR